MTSKSKAELKSLLTTGPRWQQLAGIILLCVWVIWWGMSLSLDVPHLIGGNKTPMLTITWPYLGLDFIHDYASGRELAAGRNPYDKIIGHPLIQQSLNPPAMLPFFVWSRLLPPEQTLQVTFPEGKITQPYPFRAIFLWLVFISAVMTLGVYMAWAHRRKFCDTPAAFLFLLPLVLLSFPVVFAMERGANDALALLLILAGAFALRHQNIKWQCAAGACFAFAAVLKGYPLIILVALVALRYWKTALSMGVSVVIFLLISAPWLSQWFAIIRPGFSASGFAAPFTHSIALPWANIWKGTLFQALSAIPGGIAATIIIMGIAIVISYFVYRSPQKEKLALPLILWMTALATFGVQFSANAYDYNLIFLPLAAIIVWRKNDPMWVHITLAYYAIWWQPLFILQSPNVGLLFKLFGVVGVGLSIVAKTYEAPAADDCVTSGNDSGNDSSSLQRTISR